jgi:transketolase
MTIATPPPERPPRLAHLEPQVRLEQIRQLSRNVRLSVLDMIEQSSLGHIGGDFSVTDILATLYAAVLNINPQEPNWTARDRLILSKGHAAAA